MFIADESQIYLSDTDFYSDSYPPWRPGHL